MFAKRIIQPGIALLLSAAAAAITAGQVCAFQPANQIANQAANQAANQTANQTANQAQERQAALALEQQGRDAEAEAAWRAYSKLRPASPEPYAHLGLLEARQQHYKEAIPLYRKALALDPNVSAVRRDLGLAYFKSGDLRGAIREFGILLKNQPDDFQLTTLTGMAYYGLAEYKQAVPYLQQAAQADKTSLPLRLALAHSCLWSKQYQCVMDTYHQILALNSESAEADMLAGEALDEMKDNAGSTAMFRAAVKANPKEPNVHFGLGYLLWTQKQFAEAASEFQAELVNDPNHVQALVYLGDTEIQLNQMAAAKPYLEKALRLDPTQGLGHLDLGIVEATDNENASALKELTEAEKLIPSDVNVHWRLGRLYRTMGKPELAKAEFAKASNLNEQADQDLFRKISNGNAHPPAAAPSATPTAHP